MERVLITGADGYLGRWLAARYLRETDLGLVLWVRATDPEQLAAKRSALEAALGEQGERVVYFGGDLAEEGAFAEVPTEDVTRVVHCAAVTRFNVDAATADRVNVAGTRQVLAYAERCPRLGSVTLASTIYASGRRPGTIAEEMLDDSHGFANHYERSKWEAERMLVEPYAHLPWRVVRLATVIADDETGGVTQQNAIHNTLRLCYYGLLSVVPGEPSTQMYFITGALGEEVLFEISRAAGATGVYHACDRRDESITLGALVDVAFEVFQESEDFRARGVLRPLPCDAEAFDLLVQGMASVSGPMGQALGSIAPFAPQLFIAKDVRNERLRTALPAYRAPDATALVRNTCRALVRTRWGRERIA